MMRQMTRVSLRQKQEKYWPINFFYAFVDWRCQTSMDVHRSTILDPIVVAYARWSVTRDRYLLYMYMHIRYAVLPTFLLILADGSLSAHKRERLIYELVVWRCRHFLYFTSTGHLMRSWQGIKRSCGNNYWRSRPFASSCRLVCLVHPILT